MDIANVANTVSLAVSLVALVISALAHHNGVRTRQLQQAQYDASRSARVRLARFAFWPATRYPMTSEDQADKLVMEVRNIGPVHAFDIDIAVARAGITRFHGETYVLPSMTEREAEVRIGTVAENTDETFIVTVRYRDYRSHVAVITLSKRPHTASTRVGLEVVAATLDGRPHPDIVLTSEEMASRQATADRA